MPNDFFVFLNAVRTARYDLSADEALALSWRTWDEYSHFQRDVFLARRRFDSVCPLNIAFKPYNQYPKERFTLRTHHKRRI